MDYLIQSGTLEDIADAIRAKTGGTAPIMVDDFPDEISAIPSGGDDGYLRIGGRIFYDTYDTYGDNGATYQFFDTNKTEITYTGNISGLADAVYYKVTGVPKFDRFYVFDNTSHGLGNYAAVNGIVNNVQWGMYEVLTQYGIWSNDSDFCNKIGSGKALSALAMSRGEGDDSSPTIWQYINHCNATRLNGCGDWFILSRGEHDALRNSGLVSWYDNFYLWSSVEYDGNRAWCWRSNLKLWLNYYKYNYGSCFAARAF